MTTRNSEFLNYELSYSSHPLAAERPTLVLVHGLMGDLKNLGMIERHFSNRFNVLKVDLVNHGHSFYRNSMDYPDMALDIIKILDHNNLQDFIAIGHSMGGKVAMRLAFDHSKRCAGLIVLDMAPVLYGKRGHDDVFYALNKVAQAQAMTREECKNILSQHLTNPGIIAFLLKSFTVEEPHRFLFNTPVLESEYNHIGIWEPSVYSRPCAFIYGGDSPYVNDERQAAIPPQFPKALLYCVDGATHWLHAEKPKLVLQYIEDYLIQANLLSEMAVY